MNATEQLDTLIGAVEDSPYDAASYAALADYLEETGATESAETVRDALADLESDDDETIRRVALARCLGLEPSIRYMRTESGSLEFVSAWDGVESREHWFDYGKGEYRVLTDPEANEAVSDELDNWIDEVLEIPDAVRPYFDAEKWKKDALLSDGRGHFLGGYDGEEREVSYRGQTWFVYRTN